MKCARLSMLFLLLCLVGAAQAQDRLLSPAEFLGYELGERFTPHHRVVDYVEHVAAHAPNVRLKPYGETYEGRPLLTAFVTSPENLNRLEEIRTNNLKAAGLLSGEPSGATAAILWLSYNVHGNEAVSSEAALATLYSLVDPENARAQSWLENTVVVLDPVLNPDGRERYVQWYRRTVGQTPDPDPAAREHHEPWPGGRTNHYYFDLNRDWAWLTQKESQHRVALYNRWMPHVHVDFHEQGVDEPYYFAPAAEPFHERITPWQRSFQTAIGRNHARHFDAAGWLYFTREVFDLFYPSYGDTWPTFNGAVGMTYEQGGSGRAGLAVATEGGDTLTLRERIEHHHATGLSTLEVVAQKHREIQEEFRRYFQQAGSNPQGSYGTYLIKGDNEPDRLAALTELLDRQGIRYGFASERRRARGLRYGEEDVRVVVVDPGDLVVSAYQPKAVLADVLFDPESSLADSLTYDITAWALPYAYGLEAYALTDHVEDGSGRAPSVPLPVQDIARPYAYLAEWKSLEDLRLLSRLLQEGVRVRFAEAPFEIGGRAYDAGTLIITRRDNEALGTRFDEVVRSAAKELAQPLFPAASGFVTRGADFGSERVRFLAKPRVAILSGDPVSPYALGEVWHFFDRQIAYPATLIDAEDFGQADLHEYDVLILPDGSYDRAFEEHMDRITAWIRDGGRLIALEDAVAFLDGQIDFDIERKAAPTRPDSLESELRKYGVRERAALADDVPGSVYHVRLDNTHPLGFGYPEVYHSLKRSDDAYRFLEKGWNVGTLGREAHVSGFVGHEAEAELEDVLTFGVQEMGRGAVVYLVDNPLFRGFWYNGKLLFGNAVFLVGQ